MKTRPVVFEIFRIVSRKHLYVTLFSITLILGFIWGWIYINNFLILGLGFLLLGISFVFLMKIDYPKSLNHRDEAELNIVNLLKINKRPILGFLLGLSVAAASMAALPYLLEGLKGPLSVPGYVYVLEWIILVSILTVMKCRENELIIRFHKNMFPLRLRRVLVFFKTGGVQSYSFITFYLGLFTVLISVNPILATFCALSVRFHNGNELYFGFLLCIATTFLVTLPKFRLYIFSNYGPNSLHLLGWNMFTPNGMRTLAYGVASGTAVIALGLFHREAERIDTERQEASDRRRRAGRQAEGPFI